MTTTEVIRMTLADIIYQCHTTKENLIEITLSDDNTGKEIFLKLSDEMSYLGKLPDWSFQLYDNEKIGYRIIENNLKKRKHKLIKK